MKFVTQVSDTKIVSWNIINNILITSKKSMDIIKNVKVLKWNNNEKCRFFKDILNN